MILTISNTSPLLYLHLSGQLELLPKLYGKIITPPAVRKELEQGAAQGVDVPVIESIDWINELSVQSQAILPWVTDLGAGETEAIGLALEHPGSRVILDDQLARHIAKLNNLLITGTLGVLLKAKEKGIIQQLKPIIYDLKSAGMWLDDKIITWILEEAQEN
jgi:predicted nucleic acid-binding protein